MLIACATGSVNTFLHVFVFFRLFLEYCTMYLNCCRSSSEMWFYALSHPFKGIQDVSISAVCAGRVRTFATVQINFVQTEVFKGT